MTIKILPLFSGLSSDTKPNTSIGSLFYEEDTDVLYKKTASVSWTAVNATEIATLQAAIAALDVRVTALE